MSAVINVLLPIFGLILAVNFVGDALRDTLDPRTVRESE